MSQISEETSALVPITVKIGDQVILDASEDLALFNLEMGVDMLVGLTLLKIGLARSLSEMLLFKEHFTF